MARLGLGWLLLAGMGAYLLLVGRILYDFWWSDLAAPVVLMAVYWWWAKRPTVPWLRALGWTVAALNVAVLWRTISGGPFLEPLVAFYAFRRMHRQGWGAVGKMIYLCGVATFILATRTSVLYNFDAPHHAPAVDEQDGVRVVLTVDQADYLSHNVRFFAEDCEGEHWLVGASYGPMLMRIHKKTLKHQWVLKGRATDTLYQDCVNDRVFLGDYQDHQLYMVDPRTMQLLWTSPGDVGRTATIIGVPALRMVMMAEDWGVGVYRVDYTDLEKPAVTKLPLQKTTDPRYSRLTGAVYFGGDRLVKADPFTGEVLVRTDHRSFPDPHIILDENRGLLYCSNSLSGRVHKFDLYDLSYKGSFPTTLGARYIYYDDYQDAVVLINWLSGELTAYDPDTGRLLTRRQIGRRGRVINATHDGREILIATRVGLVAVQRRLWRNDK